MSWTVIVSIIRIHQEAVPFRNRDWQIIYQQSMAIEDFMVVDAILLVGQTQQNLQWMYRKKRDFDAW